MSVWDKLIWWILHENKHCSSFCITCEYIEQCMKDVEREEYIRRNK